MDLDMNHRYGNIQMLKDNMHRLYFVRCFGIELAKEVDKQRVKQRLQRGMFYSQVFDPDNFGEPLQWIDHEDAEIKGYLN